MDSPKRSLDVTNAEHIGYKHGGIEITVLGGIRLEGLDRMRTTLKVQVEHLSLRHNLDLYNDTQVEKLVRKVAEKLEIGTSVITAALTDLTDLLEQYRLDEIERTASAGNQNQKRVLTEEEQQQAKLYLSAPNLMDRTKRRHWQSRSDWRRKQQAVNVLDLHEQEARKPFACYQSWKFSGIGKTHLQEKVSALIPDEDKVESTSLTSACHLLFWKV